MNILIFLKKPHIYPLFITVHSFYGRLHYVIWEMCDMPAGRCVLPARIIVMLSEKCKLSAGNRQYQQEDVPLLHSEKSPARPMLFYSTNYWHQF